MKTEIKEKLLEAISFIENTAQNQENEDRSAINNWSWIEASARELREELEELEIV